MNKLWIVLMTIGILNADKIVKLPSIGDAVGVQPGAFFEVKDFGVTKNSNQKLAIDKKEYIKLGDVSFYVMIKGENPKNPILLYLHGGPGLTGMTKEPYMRNLYKSYTVVYWDQRGAGETYLKNTSLHGNEKYKPTFENMIEDTHLMTQYLKKTFKKDKVIVLGHSWGTILGSMYIQKYPNEVSYYIGVGQVTDPLKDEDVVFKNLSNVVYMNGNKDDISEIESLKGYPYKTKDIYNDLIKVRKLQDKYKIIQMPTLPKGQEDALKNNGKTYSIVYEEISKFNLTKTKSYKVPMYYVLGFDDWQVPSVDAIEYFWTFKAPKKGLFIIPKSGHSPMVDNPDSFYNALKTIEKMNNK